jgi:hypothetical protein
VVSKTARRPDPNQATLIIPQMAEYRKRDFRKSEQ